jgi:pyrrolidone-carboxylate peptidase
MKKTGRLVVQVVDATGSVVDDAVVSLSDKGEAPQLVAAWDERVGGYRVEIPPSVYEVTVAAPGYLTEAGEINATILPRTEQVVVGREGEPYYYLKGRRIYFLGPDTGHHAVAQVRAIEPGEAQQAVPEMGPIVSWVAGRPVFLTRYVHVETEQALPIDAVRAMFADVPIDAESRDSVQANLYLLRLRVNPSDHPEVLLEQLRKIPGVRSVTSVLHSEPMTTAVEPPDLLFPLQWNYSVLRVPEAWALLDATGAPASFGSSLIVVAVHDAGIKTNMGVVAHPQLSSNVITPAGLGIKKVVFTWDLSSQLMVANNDAATGNHGVNVAGLLSAAGGDADGTIGIAANTRLAGYLWSTTKVVPRWPHAFLYASGFVPQWKQGAGYDAGQQFPYPFNSGANATPAASIINCSHTAPPPIATDLRNALTHISMFGRGRRGTLFFASAGNFDAESRLASAWGEDLNVMKVAASSLDHLGAEIRMPDSSFTVATAPDIDFASSSRNHLSGLLFRNQPPKFQAVVTTDGVGAGDAPGTADRRAAILNIGATASKVTISSADSAALPALPSRVLIFDKNDKQKSELRNAVARAGVAGGDEITLDVPLSFAHPGPTELITGKIDYRATYGGTSAAAPQAAAIAALMISAKPTLTWLEVRDILRRTAVPIDLKCRGIDDRVRWVNGLGDTATDLLDARGLLQLAGGRTKLGVAAAQRDREVQLADVTITNNLSPRQALLFGAETALQTAAGQGDATLDVESADGFVAGDRIFVGRQSETFIVDPAPQNATSVVVANVDGFGNQDVITIGGQAVTIASVDRYDVPSTPPPAATAYVKVSFAPKLTAPQAPGTLVTLVPSQSEGPYQLSAIAGNTLSFQAGVTLSHPHPAGTIVQKVNTELRAVISQNAGLVEIDPLFYPHPQGEPVAVGSVATYSYGYGYGRIDAYAAVKAANDYTYTRDLYIRNFLADDGFTNVDDEAIESPDIWIRNDGPTTDLMLPGYGDPGPHQHPEVTVDPAIFAGSGKNDLEVSGTCTAASEITLTIEIEAAGTPDAFKWSADGGPVTAAVSITGAAQPLSDGVNIRFDVTGGHTVGDRWVVKARKLPARYLHVRVRNRGTETTFARSTITDSVAVTQARTLICASDGSPVCRSYGQGANDLEVRGIYNGPQRARYTVEILSATDQFQWFRDGSLQAAAVAITPGVPQALDSGVAVEFGSAAGHQQGDRWEIAAAPMPAGFLNLEHYWDLDETTPFDPASGEAGTIVVAETEIPPLPGEQSAIFNGPWAEAWRLPTNSPNAAKPTRTMRLFALGEVVPHDGALDAYTADFNNNFSFRELAFAKFRFVEPNGVDPAPVHLDVDEVGTSKTKSVRVEVRTTAGTFTAERVRLQVTMRKQGVEEVRFFRFSGTWGWDQPPSWATATAPLEARRPDGSEVAATGEQFDIRFGCDYTVDRTFTDLIIEPQILSAFREFAIATGTLHVMIYTIAPLPTGTGAAEKTAEIQPASFVFADVGSLTQNAQQAFGPVDSSPATRYRTTALFRSTSDVHAYAVTDGTIALQRDPANNDAVNLILKPLSQPLQGLTPVRYFVYRGLRLDEFLEGASSPAATRLRVQAGSSPLIDSIWDDFLNLNPGETEVPATFLGHDASALDTDLLDDLFFRLDPSMQLPFVGKGTDFGRFHNDNGQYDFGFEVMLQEGGYAPDLGYARGAVSEIAVGAPDGTLAQRIEKEKILNFLDPAVFYGLHMHDGGEVTTPQAMTPAGPYSGQDIFANIVSRFATKNQLYVDIRSDNGNSLNFHGNYDDGAGNQVQIGGDGQNPGAPAPYATQGWPILIFDKSAAANTGSDNLEQFIRLRRDDNENAVVYVEHGELISGSGPFLGPDELGASPWTDGVGFNYPNTGSSGAKVGVAWLLRLSYGRREVAVRTVPLPATVVSALSYTDCVFGPIDRISLWKRLARMKWLNVQDNRYVDAKTSAGWRQMMRCGLAQETSGNSRTLLYAVATACDFSAGVDFVPLRSVPDGVSDRSSFFVEPGLFGVYILEHDEVVDSGTAVHTLRLMQNPTNGYPPSSALLLGLSKVETDTLLGLGPGLTKDWQRTVLLDGKTTITDLNGLTFDRYRVGIQGLKTADGTRESAFPSTDINVYTVDGQLFASKNFAADEVPSEVYARNYEEAMGVRTWPARERRIDSVNSAANSITIVQYDWRNEVFPGDLLQISKADKTSDQYTVVSTTLSGDDTVIVLSGGPSLGPAASLVSALTLPRNVEDYFIGLDQSPLTAGIDRMRTLVDQFVADLGTIDKDDPAAKTLILGKVNDVGPKILSRARKLAQQDPAHADDIERTLYWTRLRITVAVKSHPYCVKAFTARNEILNALERTSRGYDLDFASQPAGQAYLKVLLTGFDPFQLDLNIATSNPAGAVALSMHGQTIPSSHTPAYVEAAILPVRYRDFDAGRVETLVNQWLMPAGPVADSSRAATIISLSQNGSSADFDLERFAGRRRSGYPDNEFVVQAPKQIGDATYLPFYETTLKHEVMVPMPPPDPQILFFDQGYSCKSPTGGPDIVVKHPGSANTNQATQPPPTGEAIEGSGSSYLSNEIFYRIAYCRETLHSQTLTGHFHIPSTEASHLPIDQIIDAVRQLIKRWLDNP